MSQNTLVKSLVVIAAVILIYAGARTISANQQLAQINKAITGTQSQIYTAVDSPKGPRGTINCPSPEITANLNTSSRNNTYRGQVNSLQRFLAQYFGVPEDRLVRSRFTTATRIYLRNFQREQGLRLTSRTDPATRSRILQLCEPLRITSITPSSGPYITQVVIRGTGFARTNNLETDNPAAGLNTINFGQMQILAKGEENGTKLTFIVPSKETKCPVFSNSETLRLASSEIQSALNIPELKRCLTLSYLGDLPFGSRNVTISAGGRTSNTVQFTVIDNTATPTPTPEGNDQNSSNNNSNVHVADCAQATTRQQCEANNNPYCEFVNNKCQFPSCGAMLNRIGKADPSKYDAGCFGEGVPDRSWTFAGKTNDCGGLKPYPPTPYPYPTNTPEPKQPGCFYKAKPTPTP